MAHQEIGRGRGDDAGVAGVPIAVPFRELRYCTAGIGEVPRGMGPATSSPHRRGLERMAEAARRMS